MLLNRIGIAIILILLLFRFLPYRELEEFKKTEFSLEIFDRNGALIYTTPLDSGLQRERVDSRKLEKDSLKVILESEDRYFFFHNGVNPLSIVRSTVQNLREGRVISGASTITMQLARMITPRDKSLKSKALETLDAFKLEARLSKREILSLYLSHIPFGNVYGYGSGAKKYFNKPLKDLNSYELATLAVIPRNPSRNNPITNPESVVKAVERSYKDKDPEKIREAVGGVTNRGNKNRAPHFVNSIVRELTLDDYISGEAINSTLDLDIQDNIKDLLGAYLENYSSNRISNGAVLLTYRGEILAYIGSGDFYNKETQGEIDGIRIKRQPGSTLKPFLYELAFEMGFHTSEILPDIPTTFGKREVYRPENYSQTYHGPVDIRTALGSSLNIPAVYLLERVGTKNFVDRLKSIGFDSLIGQENNLGLGLAVGNGEVSLYELVRAFDLFKNGGVYRDLIWRPGDTPETREVMDPSYAGITRDILMDNRARVLGFGRNSTIKTEYPAYFKTGTSNQFNNIWALGATEDLTCGVWMGNFSGETVIGTPGSSIPAQIAETILGELSSREEFNTIPDSYTREVCTLSGGIPGDHCPTVRREIFKIGDEPHNCSYHRGDGITLPPEYSNWLGIYGYDNYNWGGDSFEVKAPTDGATYYYTPSIPFESQGIEFNIVGSGDFRVTTSGRTVLEGELPYRGIVSLEKGAWELEIINGTTVVKRLIYLY